MKCQGLKFLTKNKAFFILGFLVFLVIFSLYNIHERRKSREFVPLSSPPVVSPSSSNLFVNSQPQDFQPIFDKVIFSGPTNKRVVAFSFDADMTPFMKRQLEKGRIKSYYNKEVIKILREKAVPATLFLTGLWAEKYPEVVKELSEDPLFEIGNHSYSHPAFAYPCFKLPPVNSKQKNEEIGQAQEVLKKIIGYYPHLFRFPGGCYEKSDLAITKKYGLTVVHWNVDSEDAFNASTQKIVENVKKEVKPGAIIVFHLNGNKNAPKTAEALPEVINYLKKQGYSFVKISDLLKQENLEKGI